MSRASFTEREISGAGSLPTTARDRSRFGVLLTGYLEKLQSLKPFDKSLAKKRFVVLTHIAIHLFKRTEGYDLFGEEKESIDVEHIHKVALLEDDEAQSAFEISSNRDGKRHVLRATDKLEAESWLSAIKSAVRYRSHYRRETLNGLSFLQHDEGVPDITFITLQDTRGYELVLCKTPQADYGTSFELLCSHKMGTVEGNKLHVYMRNGATAEAGVHALTSLRVGETLLVEVISPMQHQRATLSLILEASEELWPRPSSKQKVLPRQPINPPSHILTQKFPMTHLDVIPAAFAALLAIMTVQDVYTSGMDSSTLCKHYMALLGLIALLVLRHLHASKPPAKPNLDIKLTLTVDDYAVRGTDAALGERSVPGIPKRYIDGCFGDMVEAQRRYHATLTWRAEFGTETILEKEHPYFDLVKEVLPAYYCRTSRDGNPVYYERSGGVNLTLEWMVWNYVYTMEFVFKILYPSEEAKTISVFDVAGLNVNAIAGEPLEFVRKASQLMQEHYPERCRVILIVNCPTWFFLIWRLIKPLVNEVTQKKVRIVGSGKRVTDALTEFIDPENLPIEYGGLLHYGDKPDSCRWDSPEEMQLRNHVYKVNEKFKEARQAAGTPTPEAFVPGYGRPVE